MIPDHAQPANELSAGIATLKTFLVLTSWQAYFPGMNLEFGSLHALLKRRIQLISDHEFRDADPTGHLASLQQISELITSEHHRLKPILPGRLNHFLQQASFSKALEYIETETRPSANYPQES